jgi:serine/threonine protein kinase
VSAPPERFAAALASRYRLEREIGQGGMATVWLARDLRHDRDVALKLLRPELTAILGAERFLNEIRINARLDHPHILTLIDSGADEGLLWYVVPFIRGESLRQRIERERQLGIEDAVGIARQVASALEYAHRQGVIHRDIKPENILLHEGEAVLADFGIALALRQAGGNRLTETGLSLGTPQYMSPEQATGDRQLDARSDVYSLGAVLYEMLTGEPPHTGATVQAVIAKLMTERPTPVRTVRDTVTPALDSAVMRALAKVPADRFASAADFSRALESASRAVEVASRPAVQPSSRRFWIPAALVAALAIAAVAWMASRRAVAPSSRPLAEPTRTQFTFTGDVTNPSISPDGQRLAFVREACDAAGICNQSLVVQDMRGAGAQTLLQGWAGLYSARWSPDGRWLLVMGTDPASRFGTFLLPSLGGAHRFVGPAADFLGSPDTLLVLPEPDRSSGTTWWRVVTTADGVVRDSIPVRLDGFSIPGVGAAPNGRLIAAGATRSGENEEFLLIDRTGATRDRWTLPEMTLQGGAWEASDRVLSLMVERRPGGSRYLMRIRIDPARARMVGDPVRLARLADGDEGPLSLSADGQRLALVGTTTRRRIYTLRMDPRTRLPRVEREVAAFTGDAFAQVTPSGTGIAIITPTAGFPDRSTILLQPFAGGPDEVLVPPTDSITNWEWSPDKDVLYFATPGDSGLAINEVDASTRRRRVVGSVPGARPGALTDFEPLQGGGLAWLRQRDPLVYYQLPGEPPRQLEAPSTGITFTSSAPGGFGLAMAGYSLPGGDSIRIFVADLKSRSVRRVWDGVAENVAVAWMPDGTLYATLTERQGTRAGWTIYTDGRPPVRHGLVPFARATYRITADGTRGSVAVTDTRTDAWLLTGWDRDSARR